MRWTKRSLPTVICGFLAAAALARAQDWPQWRGPNRDAKVAGFKAPATWPKELSRKWKVTVGEGVSTPALVGDKLFVFARENNKEVTRALDATTGKELWKEEYDSLGASGAASSFSGPRSSPTVADGKVVTLGVRGILSCLDAESGRLLWRKDDFKVYPRFHPSSSPIVVDGLCIAQLGGQENGGVVAYELATGAEKWKWTGEGPAYASPVLMTLGGAKLIMAQNEGKLVALRVSDGHLAWEAPAAAQAQGGGGGRGGGRDYKAGTPIVDGQVLITAGQGIRAFRIEQQGDAVSAKELWSNPETSVQFNTPVLRDGLLFGLTPGNDLFCLNSQDGKAAWTTPLAAAAAQEAPPAAPPGGGRGGRGGRGGGGSGFGSVVDAGSVLLVLTPSSELIVVEPNQKAYRELARIKVADSPTHAYPIASGNRLFVKDADSVTLWTLN